MRWVTGAACSEAVVVQPSASSPSLLHSPSVLSSWVLEHQTFLLPRYTLLITRRQFSPSLCEERHNEPRDKWINSRAEAVYINNFKLITCLSPSAVEMIYLQSFKLISLASLITVIAFAPIVVECSSKNIRSPKSGSCASENLCCPGRDASCVIHSSAKVNVFTSNRKMAQLSRFKNSHVTSSDTPAPEMQNDSNDNSVNDDEEENTIETEVDRTCYCDSACTSVGDCCHDYEQTCGGKCIHK